MPFGLTPTDPATIGRAAILLTAAALMAAYVHARRVTALRHE
jgi:hypothetical protein